MSWRASAPLRADLAGGTIDIWPLYLLHPGACTVNVALGQRARVSYRPREGRWHLHAEDLGASREVAPEELQGASGTGASGDPFALVLRALRWARPPGGGEIRTRVEGPPGGGIGGSSALLIALLGLLRRVRSDQGEPADFAEAVDPAELARDLEAQVLRLPTGVQDYHPAIRGGVLRLRYGPGGTDVDELDVDREGLEGRLVLAYSGKAHSSAPSNWGLVRRRLDGEELATDCFARIAAAGAQAGRALETGNWEALGRAMGDDWSARRRLDPALAPIDLRRLEEAGRRAGALAAKGCGAASGGCMLFLLADPGDREGVERALASVDAEILPVRIATSGLEVTPAPSSGNPSSGPESGD